MRVIIAKLGDTTRTVEVAEGSNVGAALLAAGQDAGSVKELRVNNEVGTTRTVLEANDVVTLVPQIKAG